MLEVDLIRHVKVQGKPALYGFTDIEPIQQDNNVLLQRLTENQLTANAYQLIICSPLKRCKVLATKLASQCQLPVEVHRDLQEMNFGLFDGVPFDDMAFDNTCLDKSSHDSEYPALPWSLLETFFQAPSKVELPDGELLSSFNDRVVTAWQRIVEQQIILATEQGSCSKLAQKKASRVLVIAHGGVIRMILAHILQLDWQQASWHQNLHIANASLSRVCINHPYSDNDANSNLGSELYRGLHQQVTTISMPLLDEAL